MCNGFLLVCTYRCRVAMNNGGDEMDEVVVVVGMADELLRLPLLLDYLPYSRSLHNYNLAHCIRLDRLRLVLTVRSTELLLLLI